MSAVGHARKKKNRICHEGTKARKKNEKIIRREDQT
jgi:hypothetical protein